MSPRRGSDERSNDRLRGLIRYSHIFSSAVREMLEARLLDEIGLDNLTLPQFHLLKLISLNGDHQVREVADFLGVSPPAASKNIDKLERLGLVDRSPCTTDRRAILISSSAKGRLFVDSYEELKRVRLESVLAAFSDDEIELFESFLERFSLLLLHTQDDSDGLCLRCSAYFDDHCPVQHLHDGCPYQRAVTGKRREGLGGSIQD